MLQLPANHHTSLTDCHCRRHTRLSGSSDLDSWAKRGMEAVSSGGDKTSVLKCRCCAPAECTLLCACWKDTRCLAICAPCAAATQVRGAWRGHVVAPLDSVRAELFNTYRR